MHRAAMISSETLKHDHSMIYQQFFAEHDIVLSGQVCYTLFPTSIGKNSHFLFVKEKLPYSIRIGAKKNKRGRIMIEGAEVYDILQKTFVYKPFSTITNQAELVEALMEDSYRSAVGGREGRTISFLSEVERGHGTGFAGTCAALLSLMTGVLTGDITVSMLQKHYAEFLQSENYSSYFQQAWQYEYIMKHGNAGGANVHMCMQQDQGLFLGFGDEVPENTPVADLKNYSSGIVPLVSEYQFLPVDRAIIFSGVLNDTTRIELEKKADKRDLDVYKKYFDEIDWGRYSSPSYVADVLKEKSGYQQIEDVLSLLSVKNTYLLQHLLTTGRSHARIEEYLYHCQNCLALTEIIEGRNRFCETIKETYATVVGRNEPIACLPLHSGKVGGNYVVLLPEGKGKQFMSTILEKVRIRYPQAVVHYQSRETHVPTSGVQLHQFVSKQVYSPYVQDGSVVYYNNQGERALGAYTTLSEKYRDGFLFDGIANRVFFNGVPLTKEDIKSQTTTVEIMSKVIEKVGEYIPNEVFGPSTMTRQQHQMLSKIIGPLRKFVASVCGIDLPLETKGTLREFSVKLGTTSVVLGVLQPLHTSSAMQTSW